MTKTNSNAITNAGWNVPFWFAVLSPVLGRFWSAFSPFSLRKRHRLKPRTNERQGEGNYEGCKATSTENNERKQ